MNRGIVVSGRRHLLALAIATILVLTALVGSMAVDQSAGTHWTPTAAACQGNSGGC